MSNPTMQRFTQRCRVVLQLTQEAAERLGSSTIESEHLLIGLAIEPHGTAGQALRTLGVNMSTIEEALHHNPFDKPHPLSATQLSADMRRILEYSVDEARRRGSNSINTEHLLLGILRLESCRAARLLKEMDVEPTRLHSEIRAILTAPNPPELRTTLYDQPSQASTQPPRSQYIQHAADESLKHTELLYKRISKRQKWPSLTVTIGIGFVGTIIAAWWSDHSLDLALQYPILDGLRRALNITSWLLALLIPALAAGLSSLIVMKDSQSDSLTVLRLTNVSSRSLMWGYVRGMLYRLRLLFPLVMMIVPIIAASGYEMLPLITQLFPQNTLQPQYALVSFFYVNPGFLLWTLVAFIWAGIALGVALSFRFKDSITASAVSSLSVLIALPSAIGLTLLGASMLLNRQANSNAAWANLNVVEGLFFLPSILASIVGLLVIQQGRRWIAPDEDNEPQLKHPLDR